jgi:hypothetical protein
MNIHTANQVTTKVNPGNRSPFGYRFVLALASLALLPATWAQSNDAPSFKPCSAATLQGTYMSSQSGQLNGLPLAQVNRIVADGAGNITGTGTAVVNGVVTNPVITATYTVDSDCNGTLSSVPAGLSQNFVVKENGCQVFFIVTAHPAGTATLSGEAVRISKSTD